MKHCTICDKELPTTLDEFGLSQTVLCQSCYFDYGTTIETLLNDWIYPFHLPAVVRYARQWYDGNLEALLVDLEMEELSIYMITD